MLLIALVMGLLCDVAFGGKPCKPGCDGESSHCFKCDSRPGFDWSCDACCKGCEAKSIDGGQYCVCDKPKPKGCTVPTCSPYPAAAAIGGKGAVAYRNNCTNDCPLLIMLHGAGGDGEAMAADSAMHDKFTGIIAYPSSVPYGTGWPIVANNDTNWRANMHIVQRLIALPDVDASRVFTLGFSSGGFYSYALACVLSPRTLKGAAVVSALKYVQPTCPHHTNVLHIHSLHDSYNVPVDPPNGTKPGGYHEIGRPTTLRSNWLDGLPPNHATTNGDKGVTKGDFTLYSAKDGDISYEYWSYLTGPSRHQYIVYDGVPTGAPGGVEQEQFVAAYLTAL